MSIALYQPDIPQNLGSILRLSACLGVAVHVIEPCGFVLDDARIRRSGMDYIPHATWQRHASFAAFQGWRLAQAERPRLILVETGEYTPYTAFAFRSSDILLFGSESAGTPASIAEACDEAVTIPMQAGVRSLNLAMSAAIVIGEALRQITGKVNHANAL